MPHLIELPKLELFFLNGFPVTRWPDGHESLIYVTESDSDTIASALNIIGTITQKNGYPLLSLRITFDKPKDWKGELIVLGKIDSIPDDLKSIAPLKLTKATDVPYPIVKGWKGEMSLAFSGQISGPGASKGFIMQFQSPSKKGRSVLLFTAFSPKDLNNFSQLLLEPAVTSKCKGDLVLVDLTSPDHKVSALNIGDNYYSGEGGDISEMSAYLYSFDKFYYIILILVILFLALTIFYIIRRHRKKRLEDSKGD